jgi:hypothetical protein
MATYIPINCFSTGRPIFCNNCCGHIAYLNPDFPSDDNVKSFWASVCTRCLENHYGKGTDRICSLCDNVAVVILHGENPKYVMCPKCNNI